ncbi:excalibur calcium-binding domain-containing protein [Frankia sp. Ag45/Mut15]|uniref:Excalibur calcium-binding domain-containing protein n=1 Tax=Frankia umida TaxID=573489 RepID=A0ABT0K1A3_9ACTN|nr:excalibur calcium-binding domain-containing protein [Frankia umida]MCK9877314.1 excalibur calcium-binding domain-containing protein [Frankia umida]
MARGQQGASVGYRLWGWTRRHPIISGIVGGFWLLIILIVLTAPKKDPSTVGASADAPVVSSPSPTASAGSPSPQPTATSATPAPPVTTAAAPVAPATTRAAAAAVRPAVTSAPPAQAAAAPPAQPQRNVIPPAQQQAPPVQQAPAAQQPAAQAPPPAQENPTSVYYANCDAVRAAGAAPLYQGQPGYRAPLDRDHDGVACDTS